MPFPEKTRAPLLELCNEATDSLHNNQRFMIGFHYDNKMASSHLLTNVLD